MHIWSFASGSDGNCYLVESEGTALLVECGRPYSQIRDLLESVGLNIDELSGVVLTHPPRWTGSLRPLEALDAG